MKNLKKNKHLVLVITMMAATIILYFWLIRQPFFNSFIAWSQDYFWLYFTILVFIKIVAIVWPPLPGGLFTFGSVIVIGWLPAFAAQVLGGMIGASMAYFLGYKYGLKLLSKIFDQQTIEKIQKIKIYKHREFEAIFFLRFFTGTISEAISYCSGLTGVAFRNFFLATLCGFIFEMPLFYLAGSALYGGNFWLFGPIFLLATFIFYKFKGRYFE